MDYSDASSLTSDAALEKRESISAVIENIRERYTEERISVGTLAEHFSHRGFGFLIILFSALPALPVPAQGIATILSIPLFILFGQIFAGRMSPWMPEWIARKTFPRTTLVAVCAKLLPYIKKFEYLSRPRLLYMTSNGGKKAIAVLGILCAFSMALPIPFTNTIPSMGILVMALGMIERDGLAVKAGMVIGSIGLTVTTVIILSAEHLLMTMKDYLLNLL